MDQLADLEMHDRGPSGRLPDPFEGSQSGRNRQYRWPNDGYRPTGPRRAPRRLEYMICTAVAPENDALKAVGGVDLVFDVIGGDIQRRSAGVIRAGGTLVTIAGPP